MKPIVTFKPMLHLPLALLLAGGIVLALPQAGQAQRTSLTGIDQKVDDIQDTLGPVPGPTAPDVQQRLEKVEQQNELIHTALCASGIVPLGKGCNKIVFLTSESYTASSLRGLTGADAKCNTLAGAAGLPGTYKAWLSDRNLAPNTRFNKSTLPYLRVDGVRVADNYTDLTDGSLQQPINRLEDGTGPIDSEAWTDTKTTGDVDSVFRECGRWASSGGDTVGNIGNSRAVGADWTESGFLNCSLPSRLYCFQQ